MTFRRSVLINSRAKFIFNLTYNSIRQGADMYIASRSLPSVTLPCMPAICFNHKNVALASEFLEVLLIKLIEICAE